MCAALETQYIRTRLSKHCLVQGARGMKEELASLKRQLEAVEEQRHAAIEQAVAKRAQEVDALIGAH